MLNFPVNTSKTFTDLGLTDQRFQGSHLTYIKFNFAKHLHEENHLRRFPVATEQIHFIDIYQQYLNNVEICKLFLADSQHNSIPLRPLQESLDFISFTGQNLQDSNENGKCLINFFGHSHHNYNGLYPSVDGQEFRIEVCDVVVKIQAPPQLTFKQVLKASAKRRRGEVE